VTDFTWRDGERLIRFGSGAVGEAESLIAAAGLSDYALLTTERGVAAAPALAEASDGVVHVPAGKVDEVSAGLLEEVEDRDLVALGGGRVVDTAKAIAGVFGRRCAAVPTTLSGAELTPFHRTPAGVEGARMVRPALVVADPDLMASQPAAQLAASALNALAHALEATYTPFANPVGDIAALRAASLLAAALAADPPDRDAAALGALLAGYASGAAGFAVHHAVCQMLVRLAGTPHAETNAVMLPHSTRLMAGRAPAALGAFAEALGDPSADPAAAAERVAGLTRRTGHTRLSELGADEEHVRPVVEAVRAHPALANTPDPPDEAELTAFVQAAL
jgi:alcohol dehydrogenase class IV